MYIKQSTVLSQTYVILCATDTERVFILRIKVVPA